MSDDINFETKDGTCDECGADIQIPEHGDGLNWVCENCAPPAPDD